MLVYNKYLEKILPERLTAAIKDSVNIPLVLELRTGKPHKHDMKQFRKDLRNSIIDKVGNIRKQGDENNVKNINDEIQKVIKQQQDQLVSIERLTAKIDRLSKQHNEKSVNVDKVTAKIDRLIKQQNDQMVKQFIERGSR